MTVTLARARVVTPTSLPLVDPLPAPTDAPAGVRLTPAFIAASRQVGSRVARLALLDAYERSCGDDWCLRVAVVGPGDVQDGSHQVTRGLLELVRVVARLVDCVPQHAGASIELRPEPSEIRRPGRERRDVGTLSTPIQRPNSTGTGAPSIVSLDSLSPIPRRPETCRP